MKKRSEIKKTLMIFIPTWIVFIFSLWVTNLYLSEVLAVGFEAGVVIALLVFLATLFVIAVILAGLLSLLLAREKRKLVKEESEITQKLSLDEPFSGYRSMSTTDLCALENRLVKVKARLAELKNIDEIFGFKINTTNNKDKTSFPHNHLAVLGIGKMKKYEPPSLYL